jgi:hypothetical protein
MRKLILIACAAFMAACTPSTSTDEPNTNSNVSTNVTQPGNCGIASNTLADEKALFAAETAYNVPAHAYVTADATGKLPASVKAQVRPLLIQAYDGLKLARAAYAAADGCSLNSYSNLVVSLGDRAKALLPK